MRDGDPVVGRHGKSAGDARHDLIGDAVFREELQLLSAAAKDKGIAALEPDDLFPLQGMIQQSSADILLHHQVVSGPLSDVDLFGRLRDQGQDLVADQGVVDDDLRPTQDFQALQCKESPVSGTGSD